MEHALDMLERAEELDVSLSRDFPDGSFQAPKTVALLRIDGKREPTIQIGAFR